MCSSYSKYCDPSLAPSAHFIYDFLIFILFENINQKSFYFANGKNMFYIGIYRL